MGNTVHMLLRTGRGDVHIVVHPRAQVCITASSLVIVAHCCSPQGAGPCLSDILDINVDERDDGDGDGQ